MLRGAFAATARWLILPPTTGVLRSIVISTRNCFREQMKSAEFRHASDAEVAARIGSARKQYPQGASDDGWRALFGALQHH